MARPGHHTIETVRAIAASRGGVLVSKVYMGTKPLHTWRCSEGHEWQATLSNIEHNKRWCPVCARGRIQQANERKKLSISILQEAAAQKGGLCLSTEYVHRKIKYDWRCAEGHEWTATANDVLGGCWCPICANESRKEKNRGVYCIEFLRQFAHKKEGDCLSTQYIKAQTRYLWKCNKNHEWFNNADNVVNKDQWCPSCANVGPSRGQLDLYRFVKSIAPDAELEKHGILGRYFIDIWVPSHKLAIEYDGLYWHSEASGIKTKQKSVHKAALAHEQDIQLFIIYEDEWQTQRPLVEAMLRWRLGTFRGTRLSARKLELRRLDQNALFSDFFDQHHLDGHARASFAYGLFHDEQLVCCASCRTNHHGETELARLATHQDFAVRGGAGRLIRAIQQDIATPLISFSNNRLSNGDVYRKLGFQDVTQTTAPSYWYTDLKVRIWRFRCRRINDPVILAQWPDVPHTERDQARAGMMSQRIFGDHRPLYRIEDAGHRKWRLE